MIRNAQVLGGKNVSHDAVKRWVFSRFFRLRNDLYCVEWGVKLYSLTRFL